MSKNIHYIQGRGNWMKILGEPVDNYSKDGKEWTMDITPDVAGLKLLKSLKLGDRIKNKGDERGDFIQLRQRAAQQDGTLNRPITVVDALNRPWDERKKIGNMSLVDVKIKVVDYGPGKRLGVYPQAVRVLEHVQYVAQEFAPLSEDNEYFQKAHEQDTFHEDMGIERPETAGPIPQEDPEDDEAA